MSVLILLSTYNGERYLADQLNSIISQSLSDWVLLIRDDTSRDSTLAIIHEYMARDPRIQLMQDSLGNLNSRGSFSALMKQAELRNENYIFFADQDDVWLPGKLEISVRMLETLEHQHGKAVPALVHSDLRVVDRQLNVIHHSYLHYEGLNRNPINPIKTLLINNYVTGCTMGINRALLQVASPVPNSAFMHDWWCALCAAVTGNIGFIDEATMLYRQHDNNSIGSTGLSGKVKELITLKRGFSRRLNNLRSCFKQAEDLLQRISHGDDYYTTVKEFSLLPDYSLRKRYATTRELQLTPASTLRHTVFLCMMVFV
jgi:glycosyltransferase involved in cell wall biosynthesis